MSRILALVGAQFGSEGKGVVSYMMRDEFPIAVRTGGPNAGHSFVHEGQLYKMQSIPCTWPAKNVTLIIGAGALIDIDTLAKEASLVQEMNPTATIFVDYRAGVINKNHKEEEGGVKGEIHKRIGSTGEGVGAARRDRICRDPEQFERVIDILADQKIDFPDNVRFGDTVLNLHMAIKDDIPILLEGTQGFGLSVTYGEWPFVTSHDTNAAQMAADAGIPPHLITETMLVARTFPIRVAGNSGPLSGEMTWEEMSKKLGREVTESTTVTKKTRRVGTWDEELFRQAVMVNGPQTISLNFVDYLSPEDRNITEYSQLSEVSKSFIQYIERTFGTRVALVGTGWDDKNGWVFIDRRKK